MRKTPTVLVALALPILGACGVQAASAPAPEATKPVSASEARTQVVSFLTAFRGSGIDAFSDEDAAFQSAINVCETLDREGKDLKQAVEEISDAAVVSIRKDVPGSWKLGSDMAAFLGIAVDSFCPHHDDL